MKELLIRPDHVEYHALHKGKSEYAYRVLLKKNNDAQMQNILMQLAVFQNPQLIFVEESNYITIQHKKKPETFSELLMDMTDYFLDKAFACLVRKINKPAPPQKRNFSL